MGKGTILRVPEGMDLPEKVTEALGERLPGYVKQTYQHTPDYKNNIIRRIDSLYKAFLFILDSYPPNPKFTLISADTLRTYADECKAACNLKKESVEEMHLELEQFNAKLINVIETAWPWPDKKKAVKEAVALLNDADCFNMMMDAGRSNIATVTAFELKSGETEYVVQYDESLPPYYDLLLAEIEAIKTNKYPKTPSWFHTLTESQQAYFCNLPEDMTTPTKIMQDLNGLLSTWERVKSQSLNLSSELNKIKENSPPLPSWFNELSTHHKEMIRVLARTSPNVRKDLLKLKEMITVNASNVEFKSTLPRIPILPQWYWNIPDSQQYFLEHVLKNNKIEEALSSIASRLRTLPLPSNYEAHSLLTIKATGELKELSGERYRSSHVGTRDCLDLPEAVQQRHIDANLAKVMEHAKPGTPRLMQTLISPIHAVDYVPSIVTDWLPELPPDLELYKLARAAVARSEHYALIFQHNHPYNIAKRYYYTESTNADSLAIIAFAEKYASSIPGLQDLISDYKNVLESSMGSATFWDYDGRELFLSSLEQLIFLKIDAHCYGSCVSGKDRMALALLHTDAMLLYKLREGSWPKFGASKLERDKFVDIFVDLYISRHQHVLAGQNAPGCEGIKTPHMYLPEDIAAAITKRLGIEKTLDYDDRLATDNEVKNISKSDVLKSRLLPKDDLFCKLMAKQLGDEICTQIYSSLGDLVNESKIFKSAPSMWTPSLYKEDGGTISTGIELIKKVMEDRDSGNSMQRMEKIFSIVLSRPVKDKTRTKATNSVFDRIREFFDQDKSCGHSEQLAEKAIKEWDQLFEESKVGATVLSY